MPRPTPKPAKPTPPQPVPPDVVSPIWLIKAIALTIVAALLCGYLTLCLLFYQGQWQLVLHPTRTSASAASIAGIPYELIRFAPDESATPQLTGWWIPAAPGSRYAAITILFLPDGNGSLVNSTPVLASLHNLGLNVFAFDYRGYGQSAATRPNQQSMTQDADSAWQYLTATRAISAQRILPYGTGVGTALATHLAANHNAIPALILDTPRADLLEVSARTGEIDALHSLGYSGVADVRQGKYFELDLATTERGQAEKLAADVADKVLANPVIESYRIEVD